MGAAPTSRSPPDEGQDERELERIDGVVRKLQRGMAEAQGDARGQTQGRRRPQHGKEAQGRAQGQAQGQLFGGEPLTRQKAHGVREAPPQEGEYPPGRGPLHDERRIPEPLVFVKF